MQSEPEKLGIQSDAYSSSSIFKKFFFMSENNFAVSFPSSVSLFLYNPTFCHKVLIDPRGRPQSRPVVITIFTQSVRQSVRLSVRPKTSKSSDNLCRPLWAGRVDH